MAVKVVTKQFEGKTIYYPTKKAYDTDMPEINKIKLAINKEIALKHLNKDSKVFEPFCSYGESSILYNLATDHLTCIDMDKKYLQCFFKNGIKYDDVKLGDNLLVSKLYDVSKFDLVDIDPFGNPQPLFEQLYENLNDNCILMITCGEGFGYKAYSKTPEYNHKKRLQYGDIYDKFNKGIDDMRHYTSEVVVKYILSKMPHFKCVLCCESRLIGRAVFVHKDREFKLSDYPSYVKIGKVGESGD